MQTPEMLIGVLHEGDREFQCKYYCLSKSCMVSSSHWKMTRRCGHLPQTYLNSFLSVSVSLSVSNSVFIKKKKDILTNTIYLIFIFG